MDLCGDLPGLVRAVGARDTEADLSCVVAFGSTAWERLFGPPRPAGLHVLEPIKRGPRLVVSTPGDVLLHIRSERHDVSFELADQIMRRMAGFGCLPVDEVHGFRYFDDRDLTGFVNETRTRRAWMQWTPRSSVERTSHSPAGATSSSREVISHQLEAWDALPTEAQEGIIGRRKLSDVELDDDVKPAFARDALTTVVEDGVELKILRHNMPFGMVSHGESGTYFIGYARRPTCSR